MIPTKLSILSFTLAPPGQWEINFTVEGADETWTRPVLGFAVEVTETHPGELAHHEGGDYDTELSPVLIADDSECARHGEPMTVTAYLLDRERGVRWELRAAARP